MQSRLTEGPVSIKIASFLAMTLFYFLLLSAAGEERDGERSDARVSQLTILIIMLIKKLPH
jgi:hypothetical protein